MFQQLYSPLFAGYEGKLSKQSLRYQDSTLFELIRNYGQPMDRADTFESFIDRFTSENDVVDAIRNIGIEPCAIIVAIDFSGNIVNRKTVWRKTIKVDGYVKPEDCNKIKDG